MTIVRYDGDLPIPREWFAQHVGQRISVRYPMTLDALIDTDGEDMNDRLDEVAGVLDADADHQLIRIEYQVVGANPTDNSVLIEASGVVEAY